MDHFTNRYYSVSETCFFLGISKSQLYKLIAVGDIRSVKIGGRTLFSSAELDRFSRALLDLPEVDDGLPISRGKSLASIEI